MNKKIQIKAVIDIKNSLKALLAIALAAVMLVLSGMNCVVSAATSANDSNSASVVKYIDTEMNKLIDKKLTTGVTVSMVKDGQVVLAKGYGYADKNNGIKVDPEKSIFKIASISKTFVSIAAMQLVEQGKLDMNAPIDRYLGNDFPRLKYPFTMKNLLTHTAGFEEQLLMMDAKYEKDVIPLKEYLVKYMPAQVFKPGEVSAYSNYGFSLAGYVIGEIAGMPLYDYADKYIFEPLGMMSTTFKIKPKGTVSKSYSAGIEKADIFDIAYPAGSVTSSAQDMAKYMNFMLDENNQSIIQNKSRQEILQKNFAMDNEYPGRGYAWQRDDINGHIIYTHGGLIGNFTSILAIYPEEKLGIFINVNQLGEFEIEEYIYTVAEMLYGKNKDSEKAAFKDSKPRDISGWYMNARASFNGSGKIFNFFTYGLMKHVTGNSTDGFKVDGEPLIPVAKDEYRTKNDTIKFIQKDDNLYYAPSKYYTSYVRMPWYEGSQWQLYVAVLFVVASLIGFILSIIRIISGIKKKNKSLILSNLSATAVFLMFISMIIRLILQMNYYNEVYGGLTSSVGIEVLVNFWKVCALLLTAFGLCGIASAGYMWIKKHNKFVCCFYTVWSISVTLFISLLAQLNLLF